MPSLIESQQAALRKVEPWNIPSGAKLPERILRKICPPAGTWLLDAGCGGSGKNTTLQNEFTVVGFDINPHAVEAAKANGLRNAYEADVTKIDFPDRIQTVLPLIERFGGVLAEGLLCNLVGDQPERFFQVANFFLAPSGRLYIADILQPGESPWVTREILTENEFHKLRLQWEERYKANMQIGLARGTFVVAKQGEHKEREWGGPDELRQLVDSPDFERYARHYTVSEIYRLALANGFFEKYYYPAIFYSRTRQPLVGGIFVFEKYGRYKYSPGYAGMTREERLNAIDFRDREGALKRADPNSFHDWWISELKKNLPNWPDIFPRLSELQF